MTAYQLTLGLRRLFVSSAWGHHRAFRPQKRSPFLPTPRPFSGLFSRAYGNSSKLPSAVHFNLERTKPWASPKFRPHASQFWSPDASSDGHAHVTNHIQWMALSSSSSSSPPSSQTHALNVYDTESITYSSWDEHANAEIGSVVSPPGGDWVTVTWRSGDDVVDHVPVLRLSYPLVWLRDNCRCPSCFNSAARSRMVSMLDMNLNCSVETLFVSDDHKSMTIMWSDGHVSEYPARWLRCNTFSGTDPDPIRDLRPELWDAATCRRRLRSFNFDELLSDDAVLFEMLFDVKTLGIAVMKNAPLRERQLHRMGTRVGYLLPCNYGETFQVKSKVDPSNAAYTSGELSLHTDLTYYQRPPGIQMLHCIKQARGEGGDNTLVDGFKIAEDLRNSAPELYDILTRVFVEFYDSGIDAVGEFYQHSRHKIIHLNEQGEVDGIVFSDHGRSALSRMAVDDGIKMYKALLTFASLLYDPVNLFEYKMEDGDILIMDNNRVLHGRRAFTMTPGSSRHLEGSYFEWDTVHSKLRILKKALGV